MTESNVEVPEPAQFQAAVPQPQTVGVQSPEVDAPVKVRRAAGGAKAKKGDLKAGVAGETSAPTGVPEKKRRGKAAAKVADANEEPSPSLELGSGGSGAGEGSGGAEGTATVKPTRTRRVLREKKDDSGTIGITGDFPTVTPTGAPLAPVDFHSDSTGTAAVPPVKTRRTKSTLAEAAPVAEVVTTTVSQWEPELESDRGEVQSKAQHAQWRPSQTIASDQPASVPANEPALVTHEPDVQQRYGMTSRPIDEAHLETRPPGGAMPTTAEPSRKAYPVYVPRHIAKQMEQEGKQAPLAVPSDAAQAAAIRAAAFENRHGVPHPAADAQPAVLVEDTGTREEQRSGHREFRDGRPPRENRDRDTRHPRDPRRGNNGPGQGNNAGNYRESQGQQQRHSQQDRPAERNERKGRHERNDRRRGGHSEERERFDGNEHGRELPPPTPEELSPGEGLIEISGKGFGFLRDPAHNFAQNPADIFVSPELVRRFNLKDGHWIKGSVRRSGRGRQIHEIETVNGDAPDLCKLQPAFEELTVINPSEPLKMETVPDRYTTRVIDMIAPIGKGQRGLIVAQPRTGKTTLLQHIADAMMKNHPDVHLIMLLVDERPEEVTEIRHTVPKAEIMASSNDMDVRSHTRIAELAIERAKRLVESGRDVFILLDSITRLGRAFNNALTNGGRTMSGGIDARAMEVPRRLFAAARNTEEAGSLTIIATALIDTGSRMDEIIFQEFKGTGNMELVLDRKIAEQRIYPAVDIFQSGTRREELLVPADLLQRIYFLRRGLSGAKPLEAIDRLLFYLRKFNTNEQMLREIKG